MSTKDQTPLSILLLLLLVFGITPVAAQSTGSIVTHDFTISAGDYIEANLDETGEIGIPGIAILKGQATAGFFVGVDLPLELRVSFPEWVNDETEFDVHLTAEGRSGGRIGVSVHAGVKLEISTAIGSITPINVDKSLNLVAELTTPIGSTTSLELNDSVELGGLTIPIIDLGVTAHLGMTARVSLNGTLLSDFSATSRALTSEIQETIYWDENNETISQTLSVRDSVSQDIRLGFSGTQLKLDTYSISITSIFIELKVGDQTFLTIPFPIPFDLLSSIASGVSLECDDPEGLVIDVHNEDAAPMNVAAGGLTLSAIGVLIVLAILSKR